MTGTAGRKFGPKEKLSPEQPTCPACRKPFALGDYTTLVALGPGDDPDEQRLAREGRPYCAVAIEVHWACAGGSDE